MAKANELVRAVAQKVLDEMDLWETGLLFPGPHAFYQVAGPAIYRRLKRFSPRTLGLIASTGKEFCSGRGTSLYEVHRGDWLAVDANGTDLLRDIAATAITAVMNDLINERDEQVV